MILLFASTGLAVDGGDHIILLYHTECAGGGGIVSYYLREMVPNMAIGVPACVRLRIALIALIALITLIGDGERGEGRYRTFHTG